MFSCLAIASYASTRVHLVHSTLGGAIARSKRVLKFHVLVTTYDDVISDAEMLAQVPW